MSTANSLLPKEDAREAALFFVVCALCFLAALAGLAARSAYAVADDWTDRVSGQITIRVQGGESDAAKAEAVVAAFPGIRSAHSLSREEAEDLLKPWLGAGGVPADLPLPHLIAAEAAPDVGELGPGLKAALTTAGLETEVDDHVTWSRDIRSTTSSAGLAAIAAVGLLGATAIAVIAFATHATLLARRDIVELLHLSGARDSYISSLFERRFLMLGVQAGAAGALLAFGAAAFILFVLKQGRDGSWLLPQLSMSLADGLILGETTLLAGFAAMMAAKATVMRSLRELV